MKERIDSNLELTGKTYFKCEEISDDYYPMVVLIAIQNNDNNFLMQKRVLKKGGDWGVTGGHSKSGKTPIEGIITEVKEELGIDISTEKIIKFDSGFDRKDCYVMYYVKMNIDINMLKKSVKIIEFML